MLNGRQQPIIADRSLAYIVRLDRDRKCAEVKLWSGGRTGSIEYYLAFGGIGGLAPTPKSSKVKEMKAMSPPPAFPPPPPSPKLVHVSELDALAQLSDWPLPPCQPPTPSQQQQIDTALQRGCWAADELLLQLLHLGSKAAANTLTVREALQLSASLLKWDEVESAKGAFDAHNAKAKTFASASSADVGGRDSNRSRILQASFYDCLDGEAEWHEYSCVEEARAALELHSVEAVRSGLQYGSVIHQEWKCRIGFRWKPTDFLEREIVLYRS